MNEKRRPNPDFEGDAASRADKLSEQEARFIEEHAPEPAQIEAEAKNPHEVLVADLDLSGAWDTRSMVDMVIDKLKASGLYQPNLHYRGFSAKDIDVVLSTGRDKPQGKLVFTSSESEMLDEDGAGMENPVTHALGESDPALAIYDFPEELLKYRHNYGWLAKVVSKDRVIAIFKLKL